MKKSLIDFKVYNRLLVGMLQKCNNCPPFCFTLLLTLLRSIQKVASCGVTGWNGKEFFALRHSSKVRFHPLV